MTLAFRSWRQGRMHKRGLLLVAFLILGIFSHATVAQGPPGMDDDMTPSVTQPISAPFVAEMDDDMLAPAETQPTSAPGMVRQDDVTELPTVEAVRTRAPTEEPAEDATEKPTRQPQDDQPDENTDPPTEAPTAEDAIDGPTEEPQDNQPTESPTEEDAMDGPTEEPQDNQPTETPTAENATERPTGEPQDDQPDTEPPSEAPTEATEPPSEAPTEVTEEETDSPTASPVETDNPSESITTSPSMSPTKPETSAPSSAPSERPFVDVEDPVSVIVVPLLEPMSKRSSQHFENTAETFLSDFLSQLEQPIFNVTVNVTGETILTRRQVRRLQESSMRVDMIVGGSFYPVEGLAETAEDYSIGQISQQFFNVQGDTFVEMLKETDDADVAAYFAPVNSVESASVANGTVVPPAIEQPDDTGGLSIGVIVAVALVGALFASLIVVFVYKKMHVPNDNRRTERNSSNRHSSQNQSRQNASSARQSAATSNKLQEANGASARPGKKSLGDQALPPVTEIGGPSPAVVLRRVDSDVQSDLQSGWGAEESMLGMESNMSYAYSLEDGINATMTDYSEVNFPVPSVIARTSTFESDRNDENDLLDIDKPFESNSKTILREITAPPGKLGLVLTTSDRGPVVQQVTAGSPLEGMVWPGDVIVSIDGIKTKNMSADQMTQYMTTNLFKKRKLTVLSDVQA